jgi:hypothetical protein
MSAVMKSLLPVPKTIQPEVGRDDGRNSATREFQYLTSDGMAFQPAAKNPCRYNLVAKGLKLLGGQWIDRYQKFCGEFLQSPDADLPPWRHRLHDHVRDQSTSHADMVYAKRWRKVRARGASKGDFEALHVDLPYPFNDTSTR